MSKVEEEVNLYKDLPTKKLKKVIRQYKFLSIANSDLFNFVFTYLCIFIPYLCFFEISTFGVFIVTLFHLIVYWEYLHKYKKSKLVSDEDKIEIDQIISSLKKHLETREKQKTP